MGRASPGLGGDLVTDQLWQPLCSTPKSCQSLKIYFPSRLCTCFDDTTGLVGRKMTLCLTDKAHFP